MTQISYLRIRVLHLLWSLRPRVSPVAGGRKCPVSYTHLDVYKRQFLIFGSESFVRELEGSGKVFPQGKVISDDVIWPAFGGGGFSVPLGFILGCIAAMALWLLYRQTRFGFEIGVVSDLSLIHI